MTNLSNSCPKPSLASLAKAAQEGRTTYFDDPSKDRLLDVITELAEQNCVLKDRLITAQKIESGDPAAIDAYEISDEEISERLDRHSDFMNDLFAQIADLNKSQT